MRLMRFSYEITLRVGKNLMTADTLYRVPGSSLVKEDLQQETEMDMFVRSIIENITVSDKRPEEIRQKQNTDSVCSQVINFYKMVYWPEEAGRDLKLRPYWFVRQDLTVYQWFLLYQSRLVIPVDLQNVIMDCIYEGLQGIVKCQALARENVWWPGLSKQIAEKVGNWSVCEKERTRTTSTLKVTRLPMAKGRDGFVWIEGYTYLIIIDYYSRWIEVSHLQKTT